jgi:hypothetical protein
VNHAAECERRIDEALKLLGERDLAYAARSRLLRAVLACTRYAAHKAGDTEPIFLGRYSISSSSPEKLRTICEVANHVLDRTQTICQPSEPLDDRWAEGWTEVISGLQRLRDLLHSETRSS